MSAESKMRTEGSHKATEWEKAGSRPVSRPKTLFNSVEFPANHRGVPEYGGGVAPRKIEPPAGGHRQRGMCRRFQPAGSVSPR